MAIQVIPLMRQMKGSLSGRSVKTHTRLHVQNWIGLISFSSFQIISGGAAERDGRLKVGTRILQVCTLPTMFVVLISC